MSRAEDAGQQVLSLLHERGLLLPRPLLQASGKWGGSVASVCQPCAAHGRGHTVHPWAGLLGRKCQGLPTAPVPPRGGCCQPVPAQVPHISQFTKLNCVCEHFVDGTNRPCARLCPPAQRFSGQERTLLCVFFRRLW